MVEAVPRPLVPAVGNIRPSAGFRGSLWSQFKSRFMKLMIWKEYRRQWTQYFRYKPKYLSLLVFYCKLVAGLFVCSSIQTFCLSVCQSVRLTVWQSVGLSASHSVRQSARQTVRRSVSQSFIFVRFSVCSFYIQSGNAYWSSFGSFFETDFVWLRFIYQWQDSEERKSRIATLRRRQRDLKDEYSAAKNRLLDDNQRWSYGRKWSKTNFSSRYCYIVMPTRTHQIITTDLTRNV